MERKKEKPQNRLLIQKTCNNTFKMLNGNFIILIHLRDSFLYAPEAILQLPMSLFSHVNSSRFGFMVNYSLILSNH